MELDDKDAVAGRRFVSSLTAFAPVTDEEIVRSRGDPAFRRKLLAQSLDAVIETLQRQRRAPSTLRAGPEEMREAVALAVRLAELIQSMDEPPPNP